MMDPDYVVPNLPFPYPVTYERFVNMCIHLQSSLLNTSKEDNDGFKLYTQN